MKIGKILLGKILSEKIGNMSLGKIILPIFVEQNLEKKFYLGNFEKLTWEVLLGKFSKIFLGKILLLLFFSSV